MPTICITSDAEADQLLGESPLALLVGMLLDQQIPMEKAFRGPAVLRERLGGELDARVVAEHPDLAGLFSRVPAIHRFPGSMAGRVQELCRFLVEHYDGEAEALWRDVRSGEELLRRLNELPGFGDYKSRIFVALLGKQYGVQPRGWRQAAGAFGEKGSTRSVADVTSPESLQRVREYKKAAKAAAKQG